jgi:hypothetical protein
LSTSPLTPALRSTVIIGARLDTGSTLRVGRTQVVLQLVGLTVGQHLLNFASSRLLVLRERVLIKFCAVYAADRAMADVWLDVWVDILMDVWLEVR